MPTIICSECQSPDEVPFTPREGSEVLCKKCFQARRQSKAAPKKHIPRKQHGTRVSLLIDCSACGKPANLDYMPKGTSLDDVMCQECAARKFGEKSKWGEITRQKEREQTTEWQIVCELCGREDYVHFEPQVGRTYECTRCYHDHQDPDKERLEGRKQLDQSVFIRKRDD
jgi:CxxC-x17-CxxC domain-containing protein